MDTQQPEEEPLPEDILNASAEDIMARTRLIDNDLKVNNSLLRSLGRRRRRCGWRRASVDDEDCSRAVLTIGEGENAVQTSDEGVFSGFFRPSHPNQGGREVTSRTKDDQRPCDERAPETSTSSLFFEPRLTLFSLVFSQVMRSETMRLQHERKKMQVQITDNTDKIKNNKMLPYLVGNVVEVRFPLSLSPSVLHSLSLPQILDIDPDEDEAGDGANVDLDAQRKGKCAVIKTSTRQTIFLPLVGLVDPSTLRPKDLIGVNKDSYLILDTLPAEFDSRVKAMEVDEKPTESYNDIGGLDKQIEELVEAIVLPMQQAEKFKTLGIKAPKGALMYGPPGAFSSPSLLSLRRPLTLFRLAGTGKTLLARACAAQTDACFLKLAAPSLVQVRPSPFPHLLSTYPDPPFLLLPLPSSRRCSSVTVRNSFATLSNSLRPVATRSSSLMRSMPSGRSGSIATRAETGRCRGRCWSC